MTIDTIWGGASDLDSRRPRVFISHAWGTNPFSDALRRRLAERLEGTYDVLLDETAVHAGDQWRTKLYRWLGTCEAAIILIDEAVIAKPDWVRFETHVVSWRREFGEDVIVIPVLLPGVTEKHLQEIGLGTALVDVEPAGDDETGYRFEVSLRTSPITLTAYQFVRADGDDPELDTVIDPIFEGLAALPEQRTEFAGPFGSWLDEIVRYLPGGLPLRDALRKLELDGQVPPGLGRSPEEVERLQKEAVAFHLLFSADLKPVEAATGELLRDDQFVSRLEHFVPRVVPAWVGEATGLAIADARSTPTKRRMVAVDLADDRSIGDVIRRATCCRPAEPVISWASEKVQGEHPALGYERWYRDRVELEYGIDFGDEAIRATVIERVEEAFREKQKSLFVAIGRDLLTAGAYSPEPGKALERLRSRFPGAVFVVNASAEAIGELTTDDVPRCDPAIDLLNEFDQRAAANRLEKLIPER